MLKKTRVWQRVVLTVAQMPTGLEVQARNVKSQLGGGNIINFSYRRGSPNAWVLILLVTSNTLTDEPTRGRQP